MTMATFLVRVHASHQEWREQNKMIGCMRLGPAHIIRSRPEERFNDASLAMVQCQAAVL